MLFPLLSFPMLSGRRQLLRKGNASNCWGSLHLDDLFVKNESFFFPCLLLKREGEVGPEGAPVPAKPLSAAVGPE